MRYNDVVESPGIADIPPATALREVARGTATLTTVRVMLVISVVSVAVPRATSRRAVAGGMSAMPGLSTTSLYRIAGGIGGGGQ